MSAFNKPDEVLATGIRLAGQKFFALSANDRSIYGKKAVRIPTQSFFELLLSCAYTFYICYTSLPSGLRSRADAFTTGRWLCPREDEAGRPRRGVYCTDPGP